MQPLKNAARALCAAFFIIFFLPSSAMTAPRDRPFSYAVKAGQRVSDFAAMLAKRGISSTHEFLDIAAGTRFPDYPFVPPPRRSFSRFEGLFAPGRYRIELHGASRAVDCLRIIDQLLAASAVRFSNMDPSPTLLHDIILASIVQKEAVAGGDYRTVASVFYNRLRLGMPLASCPTVEYALGYHRPFLLRSDLRIDSPYNTYTHRGLPPSPIAFFSDAALRAVLHPARTAELFFTFDWAKGALYFNRTYAGHLKSTEIARLDFIRAYGAHALFQKQPGRFYEGMPGDGVRHG